MKKTFHYVNSKNMYNSITQIEILLSENSKKDYSIIIEDEIARRSREISTHFHAHVTNIHKALKDAGIQVRREKIYFECLLLACEMETAEGASPYPYIIIEREVKGFVGAVKMLEPLRTTKRTNKEMMQCVEATHRYASVIVQEKYGLSEGIQLQEKEQWNDAT